MWGEKNVTGDEILAQLMLLTMAMIHILLEISKAKLYIPHGKGKYFNIDNTKIGT